MHTAVRTGTTFPTDAVITEITILLLHVVHSYYLCHRRCLVGAWLVEY